MFTIDGSTNICFKKEKKKKKKARDSEYQYITF